MNFINSKFSTLIILAVIHNLILKVRGDFHKRITYHETFHASHVKHSVIKHGTKESSHPYNHIKEVSFSTLGREFRLMLSPRKGLLDSEFSISVVDGDGQETPVKLDPSEFYHGRVFGETNSSANVHLDNGLMTASIHVQNETYHIEPSWRHLENADNRSMLAYRGSDVRFDWENGTNVRPCGYVQVPDAEPIQEDEKDFFRPHHGDGDLFNDLMRAKREFSVDPYDYTITPNKSLCPILLVADYHFFSAMGLKDASTTATYMIALIDRVHKIFNDTTWRVEPLPVGYRGMGFVIKKIVIHQEPTRVRENEDHYNMERTEWDVRYMLEVFSRDTSHKEYCLTHLFTDLRFEGGILGLAYVGSSRRTAVGGICSPEYFKNGHTLYLNSGLSSSRNHHGQRITTREADLVVAHEFGHNWGAEHDPDIPECSPSSSNGGSFLMYTYTVGGYDLNNKKFSPCSLRSIRRVLESRSHKCFAEPKESFCGNMRVEPPEECDAGILGTEQDPCCDKFCRLRSDRGAVCSDLNSPCCRNCDLLPRGTKCRDRNDELCKETSMCLGNSAECPPPPPMNDGTQCYDKGRCKGGECIPYCETRNLQPCLCDEAENTCKRCCRSSRNSTCQPIEPVDILMDGTPCRQGFCNAGRCERSFHDVMQKFLNVVERLDVDYLFLLIEDNVVLAMCTFALVVFGPFLYAVNRMDGWWLADLKEDETIERANYFHPYDTCSAAERCAVVNIYFNLPRRVRRRPIRRLL